MAEVFRNCRTFEGKKFAFSIENHRFLEVREDIPAGHDLKGATVLPGFIDAHCHVMPAGIDLQRLNLSDCSTPDQVLDAVRDWRMTMPDGEWLMAVHYDQTKFPDGAHMNRRQIDAVCADIPVILRHFNGHASVVNSAALKAAGVEKTVQDPKGGEYVRDESGDLTGVLLERAHEYVTSCAPAPTLEQRITAVKRASETMVRMGITTATDMMTGYSDFEQELLAYDQATKQGAPVRLRLFAQWSSLFGATALLAKRRQEIAEQMLHVKCKIIGAKIFADGAIGSATAAVYKQFQSGGTGKLIYEPDRLTSMVKTAHEAGWRVAVHSIGDRSTDHVLDAFEATGDPSWHRLEHAMILSDQQIDRVARDNCHVTMQPEFLHRFAHSYKRQLQPDVYPLLKRLRSCLAKGIQMSLNSDRPIVSGQPWIGIGTAAHRPEGFDQGENIDVHAALDLYTIGGAKANWEAETLGSIEEGKYADFQVYTTKPEAKDNRLPDRVYVGGSLAATNGPTE